MPRLPGQHSLSGLQFSGGASLGFDSLSYHPNGTTPEAAHHRSAAPLSPHLSAPFSLSHHAQMLNGPPQSSGSSARDSFDGYQPPQEGAESEALSTFHLPEGLAEQLSTSQPVPAAAAASENMLMESHSDDHPQQGRATTAPLRHPKLRSPPGFSRPLDGAAKPFIPGAFGNPASGASSQGTQASSAWPQASSSQATRHMRPPPGMGGPAPAAGRVQFPSASSSGQSHAVAGQQNSTGGKIQHHANLASGQWALANGVNGVGQALAPPFSQPSSSDGHPFLADAKSSASQWQVPDLQTMQPSLHDQDAVACVFDSDQHETSGLAPNDVLDFLGIGSDDQRSDMSQHLSDQHQSQGFSSNGDVLPKAWSTK